MSHARILLRLPPSTTVSGGGANAHGAQVTDKRRAGQDFYDEERVSC